MNDDLPSWKKVALRLEDVSENVVNDDSFKVIATANPNKINYSKTMIKQRVVEIEIEGKPSMILTMANAEIRDEQLRRFPMLFLNEGINQTNEILIRQAELAKTGKAIDYDDDLIKALSYLERLPVKIPYADNLIKIFNESTANVIARTAFNRFLDYIKSSAVLFQYQRPRDKDGYVIATEEDYINGALCLKKTTSNLLMIPLSKLDKGIYDFFKIHADEKLSIDNLLEYQEIQHLAKSDRWIRFRCDFLVSKGFLKRVNQYIDGSFKPVGMYSYNEIAELNLPSFSDLIKKTSNTTNTTINSNTTNTSNTIIKQDFNTSNTPQPNNLSLSTTKEKSEGVFEVFEVNETELTKYDSNKNIDLCKKCNKKEGFIVLNEQKYCEDCYQEVSSNG
jgi:hypothetical protein